MSQLLKMMADINRRNEQQQRAFETLERKTVGYERELVSHKNTIEELKQKAVGYDRELANQKQELMNQKRSIGRLADELREVSDHNLVYKHSGC